MIVLLGITLALCLLFMVFCVVLPDLITVISWPVTFVAGVGLAGYEFWHHHHG